MHFKISHTLALALATTTLIACQSINCPLDSVVVWTLTFYDSETDEPIALPCSLTIDAEGAGTLYNEGTGLKSMPLPMSMAAATDTLYLAWTSGPVSATDLLYVDHTNTPHFEAIDCPAAIFHTITDARYQAHTDGSTSPVIVDSVRIIRQQVDYNDVENIRIYLRNNPDAAVLVVDPDTFSGEYDVLGGETQRN